MASTIKVDNVQNQPGTNIINKCSTTITIGASSDTVALASGASQTGFGRTGTVDWITTPKVTGDSPVTGVSGNGYFMNTTAGAITLNLPAGSAGDIISVADYAQTFATNNLTIAPDGSEKIGGSTDDATMLVNGVAATLVYVDSTQGWTVTDSGSSTDVPGPLFVTATGGTPCSGAIVCTNYKQHTFTGPGTLCVSCAGAPQGSTTIDYLVVAGGGGGGVNGGGGGGGGFRASATTFTNSGPSSPLTPTSGPTAVAAITAAVQGYPITVGAGGDGNPSGTGDQASDSVFSTITSSGGGGGGSGPGAPANGPCATNTAGGSGGGAGRDAGPISSGKYGRGNTPPFTPAQGTDGGKSGADGWSGGGGGGGAVVVGGNAPGGGTEPSETAGNGGTGGGFPGTVYGSNGECCSSTRYFAGGGGGGQLRGTSTPACAHGVAGLGGGGTGGTHPCVSPEPGRSATAGTVNTGGGGGGTPPGVSAANGGSGIVVIRYKFQ